MKNVASKRDTLKISAPAAGSLGVGGFPIAALLLSVSLGHSQAW